MPTLGVQVLTSETPPATTSNTSTANAFFVGVADWGGSGATGVNTPVSNLAQAAAVIGGPQGTGLPANSRTATNATLFDALDVYFREGGGTAYISRVLGASGNASATLALAPSAALTFTAQYSGVGGNNIFIACTNNSTTYTITLQDANGNVLATSPALSTLAAGVSWAATTGLVTAVSSGSTLPSTASATQMTGGSNGTTPTLTQWTTAINSFGSALGPGQILAPGQTNTALSGIWSALTTHASANNRYAICDETDGASVATIQSDITTAALSTALENYGECWAGNLVIPGVVPGTTRSVPPSPVIAACCARADATGNPNIATAGVNMALNYATVAATIVSGSNSTYSLADAGTLAASGVNTFQLRNGLMEPYGLTSLLPPASDAIYWQANHGRLRMALVWRMQVVAEPYVFSQVDGQGATVAAFTSSIQNELLTFFKASALYGVNPSDAFSVNTGPAINTPALLAAGQLTAQTTVRLSPDVQLVLITQNAVPITQAITQTASPAQGQ